MCGLLLLHRILPSPVPLHKAHYQAYLVMMMLIAMVLLMVTVMLMVLVMMTVIRMLRLMMLVVGDMGMVLFSTTITNAITITGGKHNAGGNMQFTRIQMEQ